MIVVIATGTGNLWCQTIINLNKIDSTESFNDIHTPNAKNEEKPITSKISRINIFVFTQSYKFDLANFSIRTNAEKAQFFNKKKIRVFIVGSSKELLDKISQLIPAGSNKKVGTLWIDSHGIYKQGFSQFELGSEIFNSTNIADTNFNHYLQKLSVYCDEFTNIAIGSCYAAADYIRPGNEFISPRPMKGDSLMIGMGKLFKRSSIFACESWVMNKPFIFGNRWGLAGYPIGKRYHDEIFRPVWERMGKWKQFNCSSGEICPVNTIYLTSTGDIQFNELNYLDTPRGKRKLEKNLKKLGPGKFHL